MLKHRFSFVALLIIGLVFIQTRLSYSEIQGAEPLKVTTWDAFGYYMYLPATFIYNDATELEWLPMVDSTYELTGGNLYQANRHENGNYVFKYLGGIAILEAPFFAIGHFIAVCSNYKADGFSPPYQYAIAFGAIFYVLLGLLLLRSILLRYYPDLVVAVSLLLLGLATNLIQYVAIDSAMSHAFIFPLYACVLYTSIKWHERPHWKWAALTGLIIGLATISRPTELIMLFIPLFWGMQSKADRAAKWQLVRSNLKHVYIAALCGVIGIAPQLIYWKIASGSFVYDVGSKWLFLTPYFRVLFGFVNGWFIYTPIVIFFVLGFFFMKGKAFQRSVIIFCLANIWIVIAWSDWHYGATYSTRALVQSYPVFMLAFAGLVSYVHSKKWKVIFWAFGLYCIVVNLFQIGQYNSGVLHYREMNRQYYGAIYLDADPTPLDMSLLDTEEWLSNPADYVQTMRFKSNRIQHLDQVTGGPTVLFVDTLSDAGWLLIEAEIRLEQGFANCQLHGKIESGEGEKETTIRLANPISVEGELNTYAFYMEVPKSFHPSVVKIFVNSWDGYKGSVHGVSLTHLH